ncbi:sialidase-3-like isoform X1 [Tachysurus fulvidraco]|uniref:sialidase-3-like isoform X1 n=1 Tax=Tachysurus fulvidraco TaxID=1234273 RepID=UPI001FED9B21|nr:sialidase-3-like isoform X1 [Tachysurus fulvidraco]XP_047661816.1 sialidase-3-like isoform X1 [Tachysurus fulvidraco]XP_047661817.1 sialidase-3-like isoform X1 [Tachysurus fulvidraco]XP_047661818.1 sialidase-3-like isoform X1 [Tachysurus fulvidraco]XP_047661819.1 sialidase-3-like isoform X1 [Tachysurus fulvidraco]
MDNGTSRSDSYTLQAEPPKTTLFSKEPSGITYRIPALIYINETQTFLAFAEKRTSADDSDATLLVMRRGAQQNGSIQWSPVQELDAACLPGHRTMNPCPVYEKESKTLFLFFICVLGKTTEHRQIRTGKNKARLCYSTSKDNGQNWSSTVDLTESVIGHEIRNWATFAVGPGHGIQMKNGRLVIPAYVYYIHRWLFLFNIPLCVKSHAFAFYSDDCGTTWYFGERVRTESCECEMAEIVEQNSRSKLYCNARSTKGQRVEALSESSGAAFDKPHFAPKLVEPCHGCQGSVVSFDAPEEQENCLTPNTKTWLLYSHPTARIQRNDLGIYLNKSPLSASGWSEPWIIHHGPCGYSDLTLCEKPKFFACLMECGKKSEKIAFVEFSLSDIMNNH